MTYFEKIVPTIKEFIYVPSLEKDIALAINRRNEIRQFFGLNCGEMLGKA